MDYKNLRTVCSTGYYKNINSLGELMLMGENKKARGLLPVSGPMCSDTSVFRIMIQL